MNIIRWYFVTRLGWIVDRRGCASGYRSSLPEEYGTESWFVFPRYQVHQQCLLLRWVSATVKYENNRNSITRSHFEDQGLVPIRRQKWILFLSLWMGSIAISVGVILSSGMAAAPIPGNKKWFAWLQRCHQKLSDDVSSCHLVRTSAHFKLHFKFKQEFQTFFFRRVQKPAPTGRYLCACGVSRS